MIQRLCSLKYYVAIIFVVIPLWSNVNVNSKEEVSPSSEVWSLEGRFINITSSDAVPKPELYPQTLTFLVGEFSYSMESWPKLFKEAPIAIIIKVQNITNTAQSLILPLPTDLVVHAQSYSGSAVALSFPVTFHTGVGNVRQQYWITNVKGKVKTDVKSGESIELPYLIPRFSGEATVEIVGIGKLKLIHQSK